MKIKVKGTLTPERLAQAFKATLNSISYYRENPDEFIIKGCTIYFNFWSKERRANVNFVYKDTGEEVDYHEICFADPKPPKKPKKPKLKLIKGGKK
ncbi:hypothetical protein F3J37_01525 [Pantoea sp. Al-1710]|uniref:Uncharacterized protein n=1 Tax=Candidatus Pantoea communis TaxID=2608354 RepID=A0ABX0RLL0_9GAMM|nr:MULTISPECIES: hypothetical protein [Pantoea]NIG12941.1 hypothetical protein [Pantoea sp. Cy-640]NIG17358.1 hypothetical protein [Pantoea communis]